VRALSLTDELLEGDQPSGVVIGGCVLKQLSDIPVAHHIDGHLRAKRCMVTIRRLRFGGYDCNELQHVYP
jgi:hypothetical protein